MSALPVILLPGIVLPAELAYGALVAALGPEVEAVPKDLEVYSTPEPPEDFGLEVEIAGRAARGGRTRLGAVSSRRVLGRGSGLARVRRGADRNGLRAWRCSRPRGRGTRV